MKKFLKIKEKKMTNTIEKAAKQLRIIQTSKDYMRFNKDLNKLKNKFKSDFKDVIPLIEKNNIKWDAFCKKEEVDKYQTFPENEIIEWEKDDDLAIVIKISDKYIYNIVVYCHSVLNFWYIKRNKMDIRLDEPNNDMILLLDEMIREEKLWAGMRLIMDDIKESILG